MLRSQKRLLALVGGLAALVVLSALVYQVGMRALEGETRGFWTSLAWAAETLSTTGYGSDTMWTHPIMVLFVVVLQFVGVFLIFLVFPIYLIPALEERFERRLPRDALSAEGAILIFRYGVAVASLVDEIASSERTAIVIEENEATARRLHEEGVRVVHGSLEDGVIERLDLQHAHAAVLNDGDHENAALALALRRAGFEGRIFALVEEPNNRKAIRLAGATAVFTPRHILAAALGARASDRLSPRVVGAQALGRRLVVTEVKLGPESELAGHSLRDADVGALTGVTVIGQWLRGSLVAPPPPDVPLEVDSILIVAGAQENVDGFTARCTRGIHRGTRPFLVAGYGEVGSTVTELLRSAGESVTTMDMRAIDGVDLVGDVADHRFLLDSHIDEAQAVILAVTSDSATLFATLVVKEVAPDVPIIARVNEASNVEHIHRAGADFALSISQVSGQILAARLLGRETISVDPELRILKASGGPFEGRHPAQLSIREQTGVSVVAVERGEDLLVHFEESFRFDAADVLYVCGDEPATRRFLEVFPGTEAMVPS